MREPDRAGKGQSRFKDKRERKIVAHMHFFMGLDKTSTTYKNRQVHKQRVHTIQSTPNYFEGLGEEGHMWDLEGLAHRMTLGQVLDAWSEEHQGDEKEETTATETEKSGVDTGDVVLALAAPLVLLARVMTKVPGAKEETRLAGRRRGSAGRRRRWRSS